MGGVESFKSQEVINTRFQREISTTKGETEEWDLQPLLQLSHGRWDHGCR